MSSSTPYSSRGISLCGDNHLPHPGPASQTTQPYSSVGGAPSSPPSSSSFDCAGGRRGGNMLFTEDWIMMLALIPLLMRMAFIHVVLLYGTNNVETKDVMYTEEQLHHRAIGARLVLAARIFYAMFIWTSKLTVSEFLKRITIRIWRRSYELTLQGIRVFLVVTFFVVVIATLCECQPFDHYWQVQPDPGPHCRQGYGNLITMGTCDIITDILLIAFPIPIILQVSQTWKRKVQLATLFSLSVILIIVTAIRIPEVIQYRGRQQYRTVWASCEILASAAVSNSVVIGSFLRDKGTKKNKYRSTSVSDSIERASARRPTLTASDNNAGSEEDLFRTLGIRLPEHLRNDTPATPRPAPTVRQRAEEEGESNDSLTPNTFFDVGGLLGEESHPSSGGTIYTQDFAPPQDPGGGGGRRRELQDASLNQIPEKKKSSSRSRTLMMFEMEEIARGGEEEGRGSLRR